jgi:hypothetical protein
MKVSPRLMKVKAELMTSERRAVARVIVRCLTLPELISWEGRLFLRWHLTAGATPAYMEIEPVVIEEAPEWRSQ